MSSQPGASISESREVTSASSRSPATTSSINRTDRSWPIARGVIDCGKTTVSFSGSTGSAAGNSSVDSAGAAGSKTGSVKVLDRDPVAAGGRGLLHDRQGHGEDAVLEAGDGALRVDVLREAHLPLEGAVLDLHLLIDAPRDRRPRALSPDREHPLAGDDLHRPRVDAGELDHDGERVRLVGVEAVDVRPEPVAEARRETGDLPQVGEQLLDLLLQLVDVAPRHDANRTPVSEIDASRRSHRRAAGGAASQASRRPGAR